VNGVLLATYFVLWILVILQGLALAALYNHFGQSYLSSRQGRAAQGPAIGESMKPITQDSISGQLVHMGEPWVPALLVFVSTTCPACDALRDHLVRFADTGLARCVVFCAGPASDVEAWSHPLLESTIEIARDDDESVSSKLDIHVKPFMVGVDQSGLVRAKGIVNDFETLLASARHIRDHAADGDGVPVMATVGR